MGNVQVQEGEHEMNRTERLIHGLEDCGLAHEEAVRMVEVMCHHMIREIVVRKMEKKVRKANE